MPVDWLPAPALGVVDGMATKKYTVTLPEELAEAIRAEVEAEHRDLERRHAERTAARETGAGRPHGRKRDAA